MTNKQLYTNLAKNVSDTLLIPGMNDALSNLNKKSNIMTARIIRNWARIIIEKSRNLTEEQLEDRTATLSDYILVYLKKQFNVTESVWDSHNGQTYILTTKLIVCYL